MLLVFDIFSVPVILRIEFLWDWQVGGGGELKAG